MVDRLSELRKGAAKISTDDVVIDIDQSDTGAGIYFYLFGLHGIFLFIAFTYHAVSISPSTY